jgi:hypothetical protein
MDDDLEELEKIADQTTISTRLQPNQRTNRRGLKAHFPGPGMRARLRAVQNNRRVKLVVTRPSLLDIKEPV